ncbi:WxL protein host-binding domain-containing protein [Enterococcus malodoratus]|uniref:WxL Interacting Protein host binding domain-containing protein n=1 Tax=Enterococcus malodoratus ATCC 43197 TaxID=1158601 RepID=R2P2S9_9ENTE|nr:DUF3324 domain-containing protein [Enterococcus malodoratus]EOH77513.1 hypothetical protein UAI_02150 [Enterococcus malodoratus ATCC 43197]EOT64073.1 hypothetical protein I585_03270 [Enterococcus malodoratus ATCC 43197]SPX00923.1 cell surface protein [Enterococcus malodoratus]STD66129.1 cell surface protein [Enterococcus malodoratus]
MVKEMTIKGSIRRKGENKTLDTHEMKDFSIAPNSNFDFEVPVKLKDFRTGTYVFTGSAKENGHTWRWTKEFTIDSDKLEKMKDEAAHQVHVPT